MSEIDLFRAVGQRLPKDPSPRSAIDLVRSLCPESSDERVLWVFDTLVRRGRPTSRIRNLFRKYDYPTPPSDEDDDEKPEPTEVGPEAIPHMKARPGSRPRRRARKPFDHRRKRVSIPREEVLEVVGTDKEDRTRNWAVKLVLDLFPDSSDDDVREVIQTLVRRGRSKERLMELFRKYGYVGEEGVP